MEVGNSGGRKRRAARNETKKNLWRRDKTAKGGRSGAVDETGAARREDEETKRRATEI